MAGKPLDLRRARILVTNDDGIHATGLRHLTAFARQLSSDVWVVAPEQEQSGAGHSLTLRVPLRIRRLGTRRYAVSGTPTDCVLLAVRQIMADRRPDLVLSGINRGGNLGEDLTYSGTVAAAMEGTLLDIPSVALSLCVGHGVKALWETPLHWAPEVLKQLAIGTWPPSTLINVNFPNIPPDRVTGIRAVQQGRRKIGDNLVRAKDPRGAPYYWIGPTRDEAAALPGTDIATIAADAIAVTPVRLDMTHAAMLATLRQVFPDAESAA